MVYVTIEKQNHDFLYKVMDILNLIVESLEHYKKTGKNLQDDYYVAISSSKKWMYNCSHDVSIGASCVDLANKCLYSHHYEEAAKLLWLICQDKAVYDTFIYKATLIVLENLLDDNDEVMLKFLRAVQDMGDVDRKEVQLEFAMYGLKNDISSIQSKLESIIFAKDKVVEKQKKKRKIIDSLSEAYYTYLKYVEQSNIDDDEWTSSQHSVVSSKMPLSDVIKTFTSLITEVPGDWDVFVLKLVELMHSDGCADRIEDILLNYVERNPDHLNAHIYLCVHINSCDPESKRLIQHLKRLSEMWPFDERVLLLAQKLYQTDVELEYCLNALFMFLDYPSNEKNATAWKVLADYLSRIKLRNIKKELKVVKLLWNTRSKAWNFLYFKKSIHPRDEEDPHLVKLKSIVLSYLQKDHDYISLLKNETEVNYLENNFDYLAL